MSILKRCIFFSLLLIFVWVLPALAEDANLDGKVDRDLNVANSIVGREELAPVGIGDVIHTIPAPGPNAEGLTWDGEYLWNSDIVTYMIYKLNPEDGLVLASIPSPGTYVEGLAWDGEYLWAASEVDADIYQLDPSNGAIIHSFPSPGPRPHGITWDGQNLWINDFTDKLLYKVNPLSGAVIASIPAPGNGSIGLTWDGQYLWSGDFNTDLLYQIDPSNGTIIQTVPSPHTNPRDLSWDGQYIWVASWESATIYQVDVGVPPPPVSSLVISPASGDYVTTQNFDLTFIVEADDLSVLGVNNATIDGIDITKFLDKRGISGTLMTGGETFRYRFFSRFLRRFFGVGTHTLSVTLDLSDDSNVSNSVTWVLKENTEP